MDEGKQAKTSTEFIDDMKVLLRRKAYKNALAMLEDGLRLYPADPFLLSYYGTLVAVIRKDHERGIRLCTHALKRLRETIPFGLEFFYPLLYLNLGRAYLAAGWKKEALESFRKGLHYDAKDPDLNTELRRLGKRKAAPIPVLGRSNPINKYIGMILHKIKGG